MKAEKTRRRQTAAAELRARRAPSSEVESEAKERWMRFGLVEQCEVCKVEPATERHHAIKEQVLERYARDHGYVFEEVRWALELRILCCEGCHARHTNRSQPMPYSILRADTIKFAEELGLGRMLEREYATSEEST